MKHRRALVLSEEEEEKKKSAFLHSRKKTNTCLTFFQAVHFAVIEEFRLVNTSKCFHLKFFTYGTLDARFSFFSHEWMYLIFHTASVREGHLWWW